MIAVPSPVKEYCANLIRLHQIGEKRMARLRRGIFVVETPDIEAPDPSTNQNAGISHCLYPRHVDSSDC